MIYAFPHMLVASFEEGLAVAAAVSAYYLLQERHVATFQRSLKSVMLALLVVAPLQVWLGDGMGITVSRDQPTVLAAMEGHYNTYQPRRQRRQRLERRRLAERPQRRHGLGGGDPARAEPARDPHLERRGAGNERLSAAGPAADADPVLRLPRHGGVRLRHGGDRLWGSWLVLRRRLDRRTTANTWFLRATIAAAALPYISVWVGWWTREVGRQPWVVFGIMRTAQGVSHLSIAEEVVWLGGYMVFELMVWGSTWWFLAKLIRQGPDMTSPVQRGGDEALGTPAHGGQGDRETPKAERPAAPGQPYPA